MMKFRGRIYFPFLLASCALPLASAAQAQTCVANANITSPYTCTTAGDVTANTTVFGVNPGGSLNLTVSTGNTVDSAHGTAIQAKADTTILNNGTISAYGHGTGIAGWNAANITLINNGTVASAAGFAPFLLIQSATASITNNSTGVISTSGDGYAINFRSDASRPMLITNYGRISSAGDSAVGINIGGDNNNVTINQYGTISTPGLSATGITVTNASAKLTLNIYAGSSFVGTGLSMQDKTYTGSAINFYTGSYSLAVLNFLRANHAVNLMNAGSVLNFAGTDTANGNGTLVVTTPAPPANVPVATQAVASAVQSALQMTVPRNVVAPLPNSLPDTSRTFAPDDAGGPANAPPMSLGMRPSYEDTALPTNRQGFDRYGNLVWARAFGSVHFQPNTDVVAGTISRTTGAVVGYDRQFTNWRLGVYGGYGLSNTELSDSSGKLQTEMYIGGLYGRTKLGVTTLTFNLAGGLLGNHSNRIINGGRDASATADFSGAFVAPDIAIAYDMPLGNGFTLTPGLRARYIGTFTQDYAEAGSNQNITYGGARSHTAEERAELRLVRTQRTTAGNLFATYLDGAVIARQRLDAGAITANVLGAEFSVQNGTAGTVTGLQLGAGLDLQIAKDVSVYTNGDVAEYTDGSKAASARLGLRMAF